jgi:DNA repair protein SbcC/Rad50
VIDSIQLVNFQSHRNSVLKFSPGVNVIVGDPQNGKTAILRGLNLLRTNRPLGFRYHSHFAEGPATMVKVKVQEGASIAITKQGESIGAAYSVLRDDSKEQSFPKVGTGVPDLVTEILNLQDLNVQAQLDSHFLVGDSPADVAREINRITKIDLVDRWTQELNRRKHAQSSLLAQAKRRSDELSSKVQSLAGIEEAGPLIKETERTQRAADQKKVEWNAVRLLAIELEEIDGLIANLERVLPALSFVEKAENRFAETSAAREAASVLEQYADAEKQIGTLAHAVTVAEDLLTKAANKIGAAAIGLAGARAADVFASLDQEWRRCAEEHSLMKNTYLSLVSESGKCPFCFTELSNESIKHVLEHL